MKTHIGYVLDKSGSMRRYGQAPVTGFNNYVAGQVRSLKLKKRQPTLTLTLFDTVTTTPIQHCLIKRVPRLTYGLNWQHHAGYEVGTVDYNPGGNTALLDAVAETIRILEQMDDDETRFLVIIHTDGEENSSRRYSWYDVKNLITQKTMKGNWTFVFMGTNVDAWQYAGQLNIPLGNTTSYEPTAAGTERVMMAATCSTQDYYKSSARSMTNFFETDLSAVASTDIKDLTNIAGQVNIWTVPKECDIESFVKFKTGKDYTLGSAFYQLTKTEKIQPYKQIAIMEKGKKRAVYGGAEARGLLGLPNYEVKVTPGNHANYDVFVQSTSKNRKLVRGTKVLVKK